MEHRGYTGTIQYSREDKIFHGRVLGIRSLVSYDGKTIPELYADFKVAVEDYIEICKTYGWELEKPVIDEKAYLSHKPDTLRYKDHTGTVEYDEETAMYYGRLTEILGLCQYSGATMEALMEDFKKAVDEYNGMMDSLYFKEVTMLPSVHKMLLEWFEGQLTAPDTEHPFVFQDIDIP